MKDLKLIIIAVCIFILAVVLMFYAAGKSNTKRAYGLYRQGLGFYAQKDYHNAYYNFSKISRFSKLYHIALLKQGQCALNVGDKKSAYSKFKHLGNISHDVHLAPYALYNAALINMEHKKYSHAYRKFKTIYKKYPDSDFKKASAYQLGVLCKDKKPHAAKEFFMEYIEYAPYGRYAKAAAQNMLESGLVLNDEEKYNIANALYYSFEYNEALKYAGMSNTAAAAALCAKIHEHSGSIRKALSYYLKALAICDETLEPEEISSIIGRYLALSKEPKKDTCAFLLKQTKKTAAYPAVLYTYANCLTKLSAIKCYQAVYSKYPASYWAPESLRNVIMYSYETGYSKKAKRLAQDYLGKYKNTKSAPAVKFWYGKILSEEKKTAEAGRVFKELISESPDSYYAYIAYNLLCGRQTPLNSVNLGKIPKGGNFSKNDLKQIFNNDKTLVTLAYLGDIEALEELRVHDDFAASYIAYKKNNFPYAIYYANKGFEKLKVKPAHSDARYKLLYPLAYTDKINNSSIKFAQNPYLMLALVREESGFNPEALSPAGASGLMQLMPQTASSLGFGSVGVQDLFNPDLNIKLGIKYFSDLKNMFNQTEMLAVLSYNGGPYNVQMWTSDLEHKSFDEFVEDIPYLETQNYIKKVFGSYWNYVRIYGKN